MPGASATLVNPPTELPLCGLQRKADRTGYLTPIGALPGVTTILDATADPEDKARLAKWLQRPGADVIARGGRNRGSLCHRHIEHRLWPLLQFRHGPRPAPLHATHRLGTLAYRPGFDAFLDQVHSAMAVELPVWHPGGFAGTLDALLWTFDSIQLTIVDWKTSRRPKERIWLESTYFLQAAAYRAALAASYDLQVDRALVVVARPAAPNQVFELARHELRVYEAEFFRRLRLFQAMKHHAPTLAR